MIRYLILLGSTVAAWVVHAVLVTTYMKQFANTHSIAFRLIYSLELATTFSLMLLIYLAKVRSPVSLITILLTVIGFLTIVDTTLSLTQKSVRTSFDVYHFLVAYSVLALALTVIYKIKAQ